MVKAGGQWSGAGKEAGREKVRDSRGDRKWRGCHAESEACNGGHEERVLVVIRNVKVEKRRGRQRKCGGLLRRMGQRGMDR